jgi:hypothetical protein
MPSKEELRQKLRERLSNTVAALNEALCGRNLRRLEMTLQRIDRRGKLPHWFDQLKREKSLPNMDGKTVGSVVEMLLVGVLEVEIFRDERLPPFRINPALGVDLPDLDIGVKSPSKNFCTSEPFFSPYERLLGSSHDALILITDYQSKKGKPPLKLQIIHSKYLEKSQMADRNLCRICKKHRAWLVGTNEAWAKRAFKFLAYVNQRDWRARQILKMVNALDSDANIRSLIRSAENDFKRLADARSKNGDPPLPDTELDAVVGVSKMKPLRNAVIDAAENWVVDAAREMGRAPNDNEWQRLKTSPLNGEIGVSPALQWRYNFGQLFGKNADDMQDESICD